MPGSVTVIESIDTRVSKDLLTKYLQLKWIFAIMQQYCANEIMDRAKKHGNIFTAIPRQGGGSKYVFGSPTLTEDFFEKKAAAGEKFLGSLFSKI